MSMHSDMLKAECVLPQRRNLWAHVIDGGLFIAAMHFVSTVTVLPVLLEYLGAGSTLIALAPQLMMLGFMLPSIFVAHWVDRMVRVKPYTLTLGIFQRLPFVVAAIALWFFNDPKHHAWLLVVVVLSILSIGLVSGFVMAAWQELVHRTVPNQLRAGMFAARNAMAALMGVLIGFIVEGILENYTGTSGYGLLFVCASVGVFLSYIAFWCIQERPDFSKRERAPISLINNLKTIPKLMHAQPGFLALCVVSVIGTIYYLVIPFMAIDIRDRLAADDGIIGRLLIAQMIGAIVGNVSAGCLGNAHGGRLPYIMGTLCMLASFVGLYVGQDEWTLLFVFAVFGCGQFMCQVGQHTLSLELAPDADRASCLSGMRVLMVPFLLLSSLAAAVLRDYWQGLAGSLLIVCVCAIVSVFLLLRIPEPRTRQKLS